VKAKTPKKSQKETHSKRVTRRRVRSRGVEGADEVLV